MKHVRGVVFGVVVAGFGWAGAAVAQTSSNQPSSNEVAQQFKTGANSVGGGASKIGEGIKQGAILTWDSLKDGVNSAVARFNGTETAPASK